MIFQIEDLFSLADECREWARDKGARKTLDDDATAQEFKRLADRLDVIAKSLAKDIPPHHRQGTFGEERPLHRDGQP